MYVARNLAYNKKRGTFSFISECHLKNFWLRHLSVWMSVYFFIANTSKVESNKMMQMDFKTFKIKVLVFIIIYLPSSLKFGGDTQQLNVPIGIIHDLP